MSRGLQRNISRRALFTGSVRSSAGVEPSRADGPAVVKISEACLAHGGVTCMTCRDVCPEDAIRFKPRIGKPFLPEVKDDSCTRCEACIEACPVEAISLETVSAEAADD